MAIVDLVMPRMGESVMEATILRWTKQVGDPVEVDETVLEVATDKVDSDVPSNAKGTIESILFNVNDVVAVDTVIARIRTEGDDDAPLAPTEETRDVPTAETLPTAEVMEHARQKEKSTQTPARFYSPLVLKIAAEEGIPLSELENLPGSGNEGRVTKNDILAHVSDRKARTTSKTISVPEAHTPAKQESTLTSSVAPTFTSGQTEIIEMDRMRKLIAEHMVRSVQTSPHVASFSEADVTNIVLWREKEKDAFEKREGAKLTFTPILIAAIIKCIKKFPLINSSIEGDKIILKKDINIGMATALPSGNLIVPVIKNADQLNLAGIARRVNELARAARNGKLKPDDTQGGTFTFTNIGSFGSLTGTPIINQPQVAIMAAGTIKKRPMVIETPQGDTIGIRHMMYLSMSYDHRIIDGSIGASFVTAVAKELENFKAE
ncbi:MAG: dihydrolipoamide acetyltransferase family protein [Niabella sp.]